jgi:hypothetical protein
VEGLPDKHAAGGLWLVPIGESKGSNDSGGIDNHAENFACSDEGLEGVRGRSTVRHISLKPCEKAAACQTTRMRLRELSLPERTFRVWLRV